MAEPLSRVCAHFQIRLPLRAGEPYGSGHIHDSYLVIDSDGERFILQRLNTDVFPDPVGLMENLRAVLAHLAGRLGVSGRRVLQLVPVRSGGWLLRDRAGAFWRAFYYVTGSRAIVRVDSDSRAFQVAFAFGEFMHMLSDLEAPMRETIPNFHDTPRRIEALLDAFRADPFGLARLIAPEMDFALQRQAQAGRLLQMQRAGLLPLRIVHNDAKAANLLLDAESGEGLCVVDLDTVMPGLSLYDFGELVRSGIGDGAEDAGGPGPAVISLPRYTALAQGFAAGAGESLWPAERDQMFFAGRLMALENGVRFLADYLLGDRYYKTDRPGQNLDRCRAQFRLVAAMEAVEEEMWAAL